MPEGDRAEEESWDPIAEGTDDDAEPRPEDEVEREILSEEGDR
jgi:hypothetical protein